jgi:16S rRNA (guanine1207-N2)-methyltransferase
MPAHPDIVSAQLLGRRFRLQTAPGLFSADRIDDGTRLLLENLPESAPGTVLDLGCGYGPLGLPVAAVHSQASVVLVDRDLLAVEMAKHNGAAAHLANVNCKPSLGYRDVGDERFDWILCNVPARIGAPAIRYLLGAGAARLAPGGALRVVVIRDLAPIVEEVGRSEGWRIEAVGAGARHRVFSTGPIVPALWDHEAIYTRDVVDLPTENEPLTLERPADISEDPSHLAQGLPLLIECLPRRTAGRALVWRGGYGAAAVCLARRGAEVTAGDRDLLATTFTRRNATRNGVELTTRDALWPNHVGSGRTQLVVCETPTAAGAESIQREVVELIRLLSPGGQLLWLALSKVLKDALPAVVTATRASGGLLAARGPWSVAQLRPPAGRRSDP